MGIIAVDRDQWHCYERCRDLWVHLRRQNDIPTALHPALADRLGRRWWASWFEARTTFTLDTFLRAHLREYPNKRHCFEEKEESGGKKKFVRKKYRTRKAALRAAEAAGIPISNDRKEQVCYECGTCHHYHIGKKPQEESTRRDVVPVRLRPPDDASTFNQVMKILGGSNIDANRIRYINVDRVISEFRLYGEPLHSDDFGDDAYSMVALIILYLPCELASVLLEDDRLPDLKSSCCIRLEDGTELVPLEVEKRGLHLGPTLSQYATRVSADDQSTPVVEFERYD